MKKLATILTLVLASLKLLAQVSYSGYIDKYPIELVTDISPDGSVNAIYVYTNHDEPIVLTGDLSNGKLTLYEKDGNGKTKATLSFESFDAGNAHPEGTWKEINSNKQLKISLTKIFDLGTGEHTEWATREIIQPVSLKDRYFKLVISKEKDNFYARVTGLKIFEKKTDKLVQQFTLDCQLRGLANLSVDDYNFDTVTDFSVFEQSYAGPNTSSIYFLYDPDTRKYFKSSFEGSSLEFDQKAKRIFEHNQCCAGRSHMNAEYKVVNNKMVLIKKTCVELDEKTGDYKKVKCD